MDHASSHSFFKSSLLIIASLFFLPLSLAILVSSYAYRILFSRPRLRLRIHNSPHFRAKTILISGIGTPQGLRIAHSFYETGHKVVGADWEPDHVPLHARFSKSIEKFYRLRPYNPHYGAALYIRDLVHAADREHADLYINCSSSISPTDYAEIGSEIEKNTYCKLLSLDVDRLSNFGSRDKSMNYIKSLGLPVPEYYQVQSRAEVHKILHESQGRKKYTLNAPNGTVARNPKTMLPRRTLSQTYNDLARLRITKEEQWTLEQYFPVREEYTTFAIIVAGHLKAFAAAKLPTTNTAYRSIRVDTGMGKAMLNYVRTFAQRAGPDFSSHLSMTFKVEETNSHQGLSWTVLPVDVKANISPPVLLFAGTLGSVALTRAYMSTLASSTNGLGTIAGDGSLPDSMDHVIAPDSTPGTYFIGQDLLELIFRPLVQTLALKVDVLDLVKDFLAFIEHILFWHEGIYEIYDPLPAFVLYHIYMPARLILHFIKSNSSDDLDVGLLE